MQTNRISAQCSKTASTAQTLTPDPNTIAMDILSTFLFLFTRCSSAFADCSHGIFCELRPVEKNDLAKYCQGRSGVLGIRYTGVF